MLSAKEKLQLDDPLRGHDVKPLTMGIQHDTGVVLVIYLRRISSPHISLSSKVTIIIFRNYIYVLTFSKKKLEYPYSTKTIQIRK